MMMKHCLLVLALVLFAAVGCLGADRGSLIIRKSVLESPVFAARDITVEHVIYNVGNAAARNVHLVDASWQSSQFTPVLGLNEATWDSIAPGQNVTHTFVMRPLGPTAHGKPYSTYPSYAEYQPTPDAAPVTVYTNSMASMNIYSRGELTTIKAPASSWLVFGGASAVAALLPWALWRHYQLNYPNGLPRGHLKRR